MTQFAPVPFRQFVLKVHSRCDLACDHCYMYEHADQSWQRRPKVMSLEVAALVGKRVAEHAREHRLDSVRFVLHGGEPLLAGPAHLERLIKVLRDSLVGTASPDFRIHSNGVRLNRDFCDLFVAYDVKVGISLDGGRAANDRHRRYADGRTSHPQVLAALELLRRPEHRHIYAGILCTVDVENDPISVYESLLEQEPPRVDLLLPHATWQAPPPRPADPVTGLSQRTAYAKWLGRIYERWLLDGRPMGIRIFDSIESTLGGGPSLTEALSLAPADLLVIETDGEIEQVDSLKSAFDGAPATGLSVLADPIDAAAAHPGVRARQHGLKGLSPTCQTCPVVNSCGGGLYAHRYRADNGFENPSVYCDDLFHLISLVTEKRPPHEFERRHTITPVHLTQLANGFGGTSAIDELVACEHSINRMLLVEAAEAVIQGAPQLRATWNDLVHIDAADSPAVASVLAHPYFRAWAVRTLTSGAPAEAGYYLPAVAIAAAARAKCDVELPLPTRYGAVYLPTLGSFDAAGLGEAIRVHTNDGRLIFSAGVEQWSVSTDEPTIQAGGRWRPTKRLRADTYVVALEDADPERDCHRWPMYGRLSSPETAAWQEAFQGAWQLIIRDYPKYAPGLQAGLSMITPLSPSPSGHEVSATARQAFGAIAAALPESADRLALLLLHEYQHVKLGAVLDGHELYDEADTRLYYAPWRDDPRPLEGLLQGTYAHLAVADFWRIRRMKVIGEAADAAEMHFSRWRIHTAEAVEVLSASGSLTALGRTFVERMRETISPWLDEDVSDRARIAANELSERHRSAYDLRLRAAQAA